VFVEMLEVTKGKIRWVQLSKMKRKQEPRKQMTHP